MEEEKTPTTLLNHAIRWSLIIGLISGVLSLLLYAVDYTLLADWKVGIFSLIIFIGLTVYAGINYRNEVGPYLAFGKAYQHGFIVFALSGLISTVVNLLLFQVIDTELAGKVTEAALENTAAMMANFGAQEDQIDKTLEETRKSMAAGYTVFGQIKSYGIMLIVSAVLALITGLIVRKSEPVLDK